MSHFEKTGRKGHGCGCSIATLILVCFVILGLLLFSTNVLNDVKTKVMAQFYPQEYSEYVSQYSEMYSVDEALVYAVIRTESGFRAEVESSAGAVGLMQIMPSTFDYLQSLESDSVVYTQEELKNPEINIKYGTYYLFILLQHYNGSEQLAVAAYNAGLSNVDSWLTDSRYSSDGITLLGIPFAETEQYVKRVENTKAVYESLYYDNN
ncbi:MAG: lytic transglycosylase domain-containing protein [Ruminococcus sp.]|nr:lytic transglycosylase domain-containing protein [Ruminococcus sp.]